MGNKQILMKKSFILFLLLSTVLLTSCVNSNKGEKGANSAQEEQGDIVSDNNSDVGHEIGIGSLVELKQGVHLYKSPSTTGGDLSTPENCQELFESAYMKGEYPYPFVQKIEEQEAGWYKIGMGWVQESDVEPLQELPIADDALDKQYEGMLFEDNSNSGMASTYLIQFSMRCDNGDMMIFMNNGDAMFAFMANRAPNLITCSKYLPIKNAKIGGDSAFSAELYTEKNGLKMYDFYYPKHLNTKVEEKIIDEVMVVDSFDPTKMTQSDVSDLKALVDQYGRSTSLCLSSNTLSRLKEYKEKQ